MNEIFNDESGGESSDSDEEGTRQHLYGKALGPGECC
jgi:hypothetical protein